MFGNLKKKFTDALQESARLSETLQQQYLQRVNSKTTTPETPSFSESISSSTASINDHNFPQDINLAAGCNLLSKYEDVWEKIHFSNNENAVLAEQVALQIERVHQRFSKQQKDLTTLIGCLSGLPALVEKLEATKETLQVINQMNVEAEKRFASLEDLIEECDFQQFVLQKQCELSVHKQKKMSELESFRQKIAHEHQQKIRQHEHELRKMQQERQSVFDDAFRSDIAEYKQKGVLPKIEKPLSKELALEEVILDDAAPKDALEAFLST